MNYLFKVSVDERGLLEMTTAELGDKDFHKLRSMIWKTKRIILDTKTKDWGTTLCFSIDDAYQGPEIKE